MGQVLHGSATTTEAVRRAIQHSQESLRVLARRYGINQKTVAKWKRRNSVADLPTGPKDARSTVLSIAEEAIIVAFRKHTLLPLDDCLYALQPTIPHLTRSSLHRCLQRHGISQLPQIEGEVSAKRKFKTYPIGYFHIDIAEVRTAQGKLYLLVAIDRTSKFAFVELHEKVARSTAADFLRRLIAAVPYKVHTVLTDNGTHFTTPGNASSAAPDIKAAIDAGEPVWVHAFEYACAKGDIDHRLTKPKHPWTNGQVERMNRTLKDATVKRYFYETHDELRTHLDHFVQAYNYARRLKTLKGLTPYEFICKAWTKEPARFTLNPIHQMPGRWCCLFAALPLWVGYAIARNCDPGTILHDFRNFFLLAIGTTVGTWLSFSLRRQILTFDDLAVLEEDRLDFGRSGTFYDRAGHRCRTAVLGAGGQCRPRQSR